MSNNSRCRFGPSVKKFFNHVLTLEAVDALGESKEARIVELNDSSFDGDSDGVVRAEFKKMLVRTGIRVETFHSHMGDISTPDERQWENVQRGIRVSADVAAESGSKIIIFHSSSEPVDPAARQQKLATAAARYKTIAAELKVRGFMTAAEYLPRTCIGHDVEELLELTGNGPVATASFSSLCSADANDCVHPEDSQCHGIKDNHREGGPASAGSPREQRSRISQPRGCVPGLGVCFDVNHAMSRIAEVPALIRRLEGRIITMHISDYHGVDEEHMFPGKGALDWKGIMTALNDIGYSGPLAYECAPPSTPDLHERVRLLDENIRWLKSLA